MMKPIIAALGGAALLTLSAAAGAEPMVLDLTHPIPTYAPMEGDPMKADMSKPWGDARQHPTFGGPVVLAKGKFPTNRGYFDVGTLVIAEHNGTHLDAANHYVNNDKSIEPGGVTADKRKSTSQLDAADLSGRVVLIDISGRVQSELDKNGGKPSADTKVTDFSNSSNNVVTADDIAAVADQLDSDAWLVLNLGWSKFFFEGPDFMKDPYINAFNHPGMSKAAVDKLIEIMDAKKIKIKGIMADNIAIDSGQSGKGDDDKWTNSFHAHVRLLQRGLLFVENAANLDKLAMASDPSKCQLAIGAPKHVAGSGGPSRVLAICH
jgi:kynurenine formamidase